MYSKTVGFKTSSSRAASNIPIVARRQPKLPAVLIASPSTVNQYCSDRKIDSLSKGVGRSQYLKRT